MSMRKFPMMLSLLCLTTLFIFPANALEYNIDTSNDLTYGKPTSVTPSISADQDEIPYADISKNAAFIPPVFGIPSAYAPNTGIPLTPNLASGYMIEEGIVPTDIGFSAVPPNPTSAYSNDTTVTSFIPIGYTSVTSNLYYRDGYIAVLKIPSLDVNVKVYQGTDNTALAKGTGHFVDTSIWDGNCCIAGHNRGINNYFGEIHTLERGDKITLTTKLGTRTYAVTSVSKISETDSSLLAPSTENCLTLITCVQNQSTYRWAVRAVEIV